MIEFELDGDVLRPIFKVGDAIKFKNDVVEVFQAESKACDDCYFNINRMVCPDCCDLPINVSFRKKEPSGNKQDERTEQTESMDEEEGVYFY